MNRVVAAVAALAAVALSLGARPLLAHPGEPPRPHDLWSAWGGSLGAAVSVVLLGVAYAWGLSRLRRRAGPGRGIDAPHALSFALGWLALAVALASPLHALGAALFAAHMAQHELLVSAAAPLLVLGRPLVAFGWALPRATHHAAASLSRVVRRARALADPWPATALHAAAIWLWHVPALYARSLSSEVAHAAQHGAFLGTALLFWHAMLAPRGRDRLGTRLLALFLTALHTGALGGLLTFAPRPLIPAYLTTTAPWGLTPLEDQQLAGLIMWVPGSVAYLAAALWLMAGALRGGDATTPRWPAPSGVV